MAGKMSWMRKSNNRPDSANTIVQPTLQFPSERITMIITSQTSHWSLMVYSMFWLAEGLHRAQNLEIIAVIIQTLPFSHLLLDSHQHFTVYSDTLIFGGYLHKTFTIKIALLCWRAVNQSSVNWSSFYTNLLPTIRPRVTLTEIFRKHHFQQFSIIKYLV